ncbi:RNA polymerase sigma factor [Nocardioides sp.]|uniref:RNA polymerase sigma factor n=1 Tax=Nocardioides sp. TaxID=35761 RepID=UPI002F3FA32E
MTEVATATRTTADHAWFSEQVESTLPELYGAAARLCRSRADAEDLVAESLTKAWQGLPSLRRREAFRCWVLQIVANTYFSQYRRARTGPEIDNVGADAADFSLFERLHQPILLWWGNPEQEFLNGLLREDLQRALDQLPAQYRTVVVLVDIQEMRYRDVADCLEIPVGTVRSRLARGRGLLQQHLWQHALQAGLRPDGTDEGETP